jgi:ankyrin repeat protein
MSSIHRSKDLYESSSEDSDIEFGNVSEIYARRVAATAVEIPPLGPDDLSDTALALFDAFVNNDAYSLATLAENGAFIDARNAANGWRPIHCAAALGNTNMITILYNAHANMNALTPYGETALHIAAREMHADAVLLLLYMGVNPEIISAPVSGSDTAFNIAALGRTLQICRHRHPATQHELLASNAMVAALQPPETHHWGDIMP